MNVLHFDPIGGASGDMMLAVLFELGVNPLVIGEALDSLIGGGIHLHIEPADDHGIHGTRVTVHAHETQGRQPHEHNHDHTQTPHADAPHRNLDAIRNMIESSRLPEPVKASSLDVFQRIAQVEAKIHGTTIDRIHFHEIGALDSIADIVGCCLGLHLLDVESVSVAALPTGHGTIECAHGTYPNPAPATVELSKGMTMTHVDEPFELVTPTGAALLAAWKTSDAPPANARLVSCGYGIGHHQLNRRPNVLRATLLETTDAVSATDTALLMECNLDDTTPEIVGALMERLLHEGALDVFTVPIQMKKQRPGVVLTVLCRAEDRDTMLDLIFTESTTFGIRETPMTRTVLERRTETMNTPYGTVRVKIGTWKGRDITRSPEMDDCIARAKEHRVSVRTVYAAAATAAEQAPPS